jgi:hypothetical protein
MRADDDTARAPSDAATTLPAMLRAFRLGALLTQDELAERSRMSVGTIAVVQRLADRRHQPGQLADRCVPGTGRALITPYGWWPSRRRWRTPAASGRSRSSYTARACRHRWRA